MPTGWGSSARPAPWQGPGAERLARRSSAAALLLAGAALLLLAIAAHAQAATHDVTISGFRFSPQSIDVSAGDAIRFTNNDGAPHTATSSGSWDSGTIPANGGEATVTFPTAGTYTYVCRNHQSMTGTVRVFAQQAQNAAPTIVVSSPPGGATVRGIATISGTAADANNDPLSVTIRVDNGDWQSASLSGTTWTFAWDTRTLPNGPHSITARASDGKVTSVSATFSFQVYNPPTIALLTPTGDVNGTIGRPVVFTGTATAAPGSPLAIEVSIDGEDWRPASGRSQWSFAWNTSAALAGNHTFQARAGDGASFALSALRNVTLVEAPVAPPNEPPVVAIFSPSERASVAGLVNLTGNATDADGPIPLVEVNVGGTGWRNVSGRMGSAWWYHFVPEGMPAGPLTFQVRASDAHGSVTIERHVALLAEAPPVSVVVEESPREGADVRVTIRSAAPEDAPLAGARVLMFEADGALLAERSTNATGVATLPPTRAGNYTLRAYAPGAAASFPLTIVPRYQVTVGPAQLHFVDVTAITVNVASEEPVSNALVQLRGAPLPGGESEIITTGRDGNASFVPQALQAGELEVWVGGNDTGLRVRVIPTLFVSWSPDPPAPDEDVTVRLVLNDAASTPAAGARVAVDLPGGAEEALVADARGEVVLRAASPGTIFLEATLGEVKPVRAEIAVRMPPGAAELADLSLRAMPGRVDAGAIVRNVGNGAGSFIVDALATSSSGAILQRSFTTGLLAPGEHELAAFQLPVGPGQYAVTLSVRNSAATIAGNVSVVSDGLPPRIEPVLDLSTPTPEEREETPAVGLLVVVVAGVVAVSRRRR